MINEISKNSQKFPLYRRIIQNLSVVLYVNCLIIVPYIVIFLIPFLVLNFNSFGQVCVLLYLFYIYLVNTKRLPIYSGNCCMFLRHNFVTTHLRNYFPIELIKTAELDPKRNYLMASFPHGITCTGITNNMGNNIGTFLKIFPGIRPKIATLNIFFYMPFFREIYSALGCISCSEETLKYYLSKSNDPQHKDNNDGFTSNAVAIMVGGVKEMLDSKPGNYRLTLRNRKGFVKIAIKTGSPIVPTFSFGEVEIFDEVNRLSNNWLRKFETIVAIYNLFKCSFGFLPQRKRIVQVVGAPIDVMKMSNPSPEYVDEIHQKVIDSLNDLFDEYKHEYVENADNVKLVIV